MRPLDRIRKNNAAKDIGDADHRAGIFALGFMTNSIDPGGFRSAMDVIVFYAFADDMLWKQL